jgi:hypothetical protein
MPKTDIVFFHRKLHLMFIPARFRRFLMKVTGPFGPEGPKPHLVCVEATQEPGASSEALRQNRSGFWAPGVAHAVCLSPVARPLPAYRTGESPEEERGSRLRTRESADMVTDWSRSLARLLEASRRAPRAALRRRRQGRYSKSSASPPRGFERGTRLYVRTVISQAVGESRPRAG